MVERKDLTLVEMKVFLKDILSGKHPAAARVACWALEKVSYMAALKADLLVVSWDNDWGS